MADTDRNAALQVEKLHVHYGEAHVLQGVDLNLARGILALVGRNGMGKTTLCRAIMGLHPVTSGEIHAYGQSLIGLEPHQTTSRGLAYVPQGRRVWASLSVDEHLRVVASKDGDWTIDRIYEVFPRLAERRRNGGAELSGGEQQMLAIARALLQNPRLLIMDEPTEGLAPVIVDQIVALLAELADDGNIDTLLVEQNLKAALTVAPRIAVMVNGRIAAETDSATLAADREMQRRMLGVAGEATDVSHNTLTDSEADPDHARGETTGAVTPSASTLGFSMMTRWGHGTPAARPPAPDIASSPGSAPPTIWDKARSQSDSGATPNAEQEPSPDWPEPAMSEPFLPSTPAAPALDAPFRRDPLRVAYVAGTFDTKARELEFLIACLMHAGVAVRSVDLSTSERPSFADVPPTLVADAHPQGRRAVFTGDRGAAVTAMAEAFSRWLTRQRDLGGVIGAGGSGATALVTPAMRMLPVGVPKIMVSTVASGDVSAYVGPSDITMMHSVTDVAGLNRISEAVLGNAAHALAGMVGTATQSRKDHKPAIGLSMFGVTTPCVQAVKAGLENDRDCLVFHATGTGGQAMEKLAAEGLLSELIDLTLTEVCDFFMGGVMSAGEGRLDVLAEREIPYVGSLGALDMVNWGAWDTVPTKFRDRTLYAHNPQVTLMRTTPEECAQMGAWIGRKLSAARGPVRFLIPEGGVSLLDAPGQLFHDQEADRALFDALEANFQQLPNRRLIRRPENINDPEFSRAVIAQWHDIALAPRK